LEKFIYEAHRIGIYAIIDTIGLEDPVALLNSLKELPDVVILHRSIDAETQKDRRWDILKQIKAEFKNKILVGVAGGIDLESAPKALKHGADILVVGRAITQSRDIERSARRFIDLIGYDIDQFRIHVE
jgi:bifunctional enzyme Fae/Hps